jgi:hypothetical protein
MLANAVLLIHFLLVLFITAGLPMIYLGAALGWSWVRAWQWRALHLAAIVFVAACSLWSRPFFFKRLLVQCALRSPSAGFEHDGLQLERALGQSEFVSAKIITCEAR